MTTLEALTKRMKELDEENKILKQLLVTRNSSVLGNRTHLQLHLIAEKVINEFSELTVTQKRLTARTSKLSGTIFKPDQGTKSILDAILFEQFEVVCGKNDLLKGKMAIFQGRLNAALIASEKIKTQWSDPNVQQFVFAQKMTSKQRKKFIKKCKTDDNAAQKTLTTFETLHEDWDGIKSDLQECVDQVELIYDAYRAARN